MPIIMIEVSRAKNKSIYGLLPYNELVKPNDNNDAVIKRIKSEVQKKICRNEKITVDNFTANRLLLSSNTLFEKTNNTVK